MISIGVENNRDRVAAAAERAEATRNRGRELSDRLQLETDFSGAYLARTRWAEAGVVLIFDNKDLRKANFSYSTLDDWSFDGANLKGANLRGTRLARVDFTNSTGLTSEMVSNSCWYTAADSEAIGYRVETIWPEAFEPPARSSVCQGLAEP